MSKNNKKALIQSEQNKKPKLILKKFDENVKYQYELIDIFEKAKEVSKYTLLCMIQEAKEESGKAYVVERLTNILNERFNYV